MCSSSLEIVIADREAIEDTLVLLGHEASRSAITISKELEHTDLRVLGADSELRIIVLNLVQNAFHAMPNGGELMIISRVVGKRVHMIFEDTGLGVRPEDVAHIFEPFFSHRADGMKGTGLGLSICKSIVDRYGGRMNLDNRAMSGARFVVELPNADAVSLTDSDNTNEKGVARKGLEIESIRQ